MIPSLASRLSARPAAEMADDRLAIKLRHLGGLLQQGAFLLPSRTLLVAIVLDRQIVVTLVDIHSSVWHDSSGDIFDEGTIHLR